jgi:putative spermidine/putrescine transport system permease protein
VRRAGRRVDGTLALAAPAVLLLVAVFAVPIGLVLSISVTEPGLGLANYALLVSSPGVRAVLGKTFQIAATVTVLAVAFGYVFAFAMAQVESTARTILLSCVLVPLWASVLIRAFAWVTLLRTNGLVNQAALALGLLDAPLPLMRNDLGVVIGMVHVMLPLATLPIYSVMQAIDRRLVPAARSLGASEGRALLAVFVPLSLPGVAAAAVLVFVTALGFFITPAVLGGGKTVMAAEYINLQITATLRWGLGAMMATVLLATVLCLFALGARLPAFRAQYRL